jgi:malonyl-CoA/methylmalonyl-CoA synthetase
VAAHFLDELRRTFAENTARPALIHQGRTFTYGELNAQVKSIAAWLQGFGLRPGDRLALWTSARLPFLLAHLAGLQTGAVVLPLNPRFTADEIRFFLTDSGARLAVAGPEQHVLLDRLRPELPDLQTILSDDISAVPNATPREIQPAANDACMILYSSGTTGWPKGVVHTHANLASSLRALAACWRITPEDVVVHVLPLFHIHGLSFAALLSLLTGCQLLLEDGFHPQHTLDAIGRGTVFMAVPTIYYRFLQEPSFRDKARSWQRVRLFTCGSAPIRPDVLPELEGILGRPIINRYGMTEAHVLTSLPLDGPWPYGSVGLPLEGIELRVVREDGQPASVGEVGAIHVRGPNLFREYWRKPEAARKAFATSWFETGDLGSLDARGFLSLVGRSNDLIIVGGYNIYPQVVERVVNACPGVRETAVVGIPDDIYGERVVAVVVRDDPSLDETRLRLHWNERLVDYQRPRDVVFVDGLPRNALGKVLLGELRELLQRPR